MEIDATGFMRRDIDSLFSRMDPNFSNDCVDHETAHAIGREEREQRIERPNEAIDVPIKDEKSPLSEPQGSPRDVAIHRMIKESVDATIAAERARQANVRNDARGSRQ
ncbi:hypothetical protein Tco_0323202 [Tanacetum coccineum]